MRHAAASSPAPAAPAAPKKPEPLIQAEPPPFSEGIYPCSACHADQKNAEKRDLAFHDDQAGVLAHGERWCLDCHDFADRDVLRLANGAKVPFTESYRLCGQCHGDKLRDWKVGVHGKRTGHWDGEKTYFLCVNCHDPHSPRFKGVTTIEVAGKKTTRYTHERVKPEPRPRRPEEMAR
ncbi:MAG: hypothetical protein U0229_01100 [Anaeromyxobacter sp.]